MAKNLTERPNHSPQAKSYRGQMARNRRPFWLPASSYYILAIAVVTAFFFLIWGVLHDEREEAPWITAGIAASIGLGGAVFLREVIMRAARNRYIANRKRLDKSLHGIPLAGGAQIREKLTLEKNAFILKQIKQKSDAANVLGKLSDGHREVFEMCSEYLEISSSEMSNAGVGSPRLPALRKGRNIVQDLHRFHLLQWAEIESRALTQEARNHAKMSEKLATVHNALAVLESALQFYPDEISLLRSEEALKEFVASIKISNWIERAERATFNGNYKLALRLYRDALFYLGRENIKGAERDMAAEKITAEIEKIRQLEGKN